MGREDRGRFVLQVSPLALPAFSSSACIDFVGLCLLHTSPRSYPKEEWGDVCFEGAEWAGEKSEDETSGMLDRDGGAGGGGGDGGGFSVEEKEELLHALCGL